MLGIVGLGLVVVGVEEVDCELGRVTVVDVVAILAAVPQAQRHVEKTIVARIALREVMGLERSRVAPSPAVCRPGSPRAATLIPLHCADIPMTGRPACNDR